MSQEIAVKQVLKLREVSRRTGKSAAAIYREVKAGTFPKPVKLGARASGWVSSEIDAWIAERIAQRDMAA